MLYRAGRRGQRVLIHFKANITCGDGCYRLRGFNQKDSNAIVQYLSQVNSLLNAGRTKSSAEFSYGGRTVEISFFRGKKGGIFSACSGVTAEEGVNKKIPACGKITLLLMKVHSIGQLFVYSPSWLYMYTCVRE